MASLGVLGGDIVLYIMTPNDKIASLDQKIDRLRHEWLKAETDVDRNLIERRAKLLILAKQAIERKQQTSKPDIYEVAKAIFSSPPSGQQARTSSAAPGRETGPDEDTSA